jgi:hypothetical protein
MSARKAHARQMKLLARIANLGHYRVGQWVELPQIKQGLDCDGDVFIDKTSPGPVSRGALKPATDGRFKTGQCCKSYTSSSWSYSNGF